MVWQTGILFKSDWEATEQSRHYQFLKPYISPYTLEAMGLPATPTTPYLPTGASSVYSPACANEFFVFCGTCKRVQLEHRGPVSRVRAKANTGCCMWLREAKVDRERRRLATITTTVLDAAGSVAMSATAVAAMTAVTNPTPYGANAIEQWPPIRNNSGRKRKRNSPVVGLLSPQPLPPCTFATTTAASTRLGSRDQRHKQPRPTEVTEAQARTECLQRSSPSLSATSHVSPLLPAITLSPSPPVISPSPAECNPCTTNDYAARYPVLPLPRVINSARLIAELQRRHNTTPIARIE